MWLDIPDGGGGVMGVYQLGEGGVEGCGGYKGVAEVTAVEVDYPVFGFSDVRRC